MSGQLGDAGPEQPPLLSLPDARRIFERYMKEHPPAGRGELEIGDVWRGDDEYFLPRWELRNPFEDPAAPPRLENTILLIDRRTGDVIESAFTANYRRIRAMQTFPAPAEI